MDVMIETLLHLLTPHHTNNYRAKLLQPAGLTVLVSIFLLSQVWVKILVLSPELPGGFVLGFASNITAQQTIDQTNLQRESQGLPPLKMSSSLNQAAVAKANHMFANNYWAHVAPDGTTPWVFIRNAGYRYAVAGENLARDFDTTGSMIGAWMDSPTHRENVVNPKYSEIGVAVVNGTLEGVETTLVVQLFGQPAQAIAQTVPAINTENPNPAPVNDANPTIIPTLVPTAEPTIPSPSVNINQLTLGTTLSAPNSKAEGHVLISPLILNKSITAAIIVLIIGVLIYDLAYMQHKKLPRRVSKNWAHITVLAFVLIFIMIVTQGKVL
jgi:hypothetical protein